MSHSNVVSSLISSFVFFLVAPLPNTHNCTYIPVLTHFTILPYRHTEVNKIRSDAFKKLPHHFQQRLLNIDIEVAQRAVSSEGR